MPVARISAASEGDLGHATMVRHTIKKKAGTNIEMISIPLGLSMGCSYVVEWRLSAARSAVHGLASGVTGRFSAFDII